VTRLLRSWRGHGARGLASFATLVYRRFELAAHLRTVIRQLERIERGEIDRLMLFLPPRHGKSLITSQLFRRGTWADIPIAA
jgi:hypothetical protein